jgi:hypothetical protein
MNIKIKINFELPYYNLFITIFVWLALIPQPPFITIYKYELLYTRI